MNIAIVVTGAAALLLSVAAIARAEDDNGRASAENAMQAYLAMWSRDRDVNAQSVARFYAPQVDYYGKPMSRAQVLADKQAFVRNWPERHYSQAPGTFSGSCNRDRSRCTISAVLEWRRVDRGGRGSQGRARLRLEFIPADGTRKIARESALPL